MDWAPPIRARGQGPSGRWATVVGRSNQHSLAPLVFFGTTGTMLDIITGISQCEREHAERQMKLLEAQKLSADASAESESSDSFGSADK